jgi:hypothetical protein
MPDSHAWEKIHAAVLILAAGSGPLRERLNEAHVSSLQWIRPEHFTYPDIRDQFVSLMSHLSRENRPYIGLETIPNAN